MNIELREKQLLLQISQLHLEMLRILIAVRQAASIIQK